jgi:PBP1b-binding outer membrane lipoprotein LpoB
MIMKFVKFYWLLVLSAIVIAGCGGKKADESKPISEVKTEAEKMDSGQLRSMAMTYKEAIVAKKGEVEKIAAKLKEIPVTELLGEKAKQLKTDIDSLTKSVDALKARFDVYYAKLKEKSGDLSGLEL